MSQSFDFEQTPLIPWAERGRCRGADPKQFHAPFGEDAHDRIVRENDVKTRYCALRGRDDVSRLGAGPSRVRSVGR